MAMWENISSIFLAHGAGMREEKIFYFEGKTSPFVEVSRRKEGENMRQYKTLYIPAKSEKVDAEEITRVIQIWSEDGAVLHSIVPRVYEGSTEGYIIVLDITEVD